jgi:hypothetical protein
MSEAQIDADRDHKTDDDPERHAMLNGGHGHIADGKCDRERKDLSNSFPLHGISLYRTVFTIKMRPSTITIIVNSMLLAPKPIVGISDITISVITPAASITARIMKVALNANESLLIPLRPYRQFGATRAQLSTISG